MVRVKICGITTLEDATCAVDAGATAIGFNFCDRSPRYLAPATARAIGRDLPAEVWRVGVFVTTPRDEVARIIDTAGLTAVQFHGNESIASCRNWPCPVIKAFRVRGRADVAAALAYPVDFVLADTYVEGTLGGTGTRFDWTLLQGCDCSRLFLAGGLTPATVADAVRQVRPYAVDVASGVERAPGIKDHEKVRQFVIHAQNA